MDNRKYTAFCGLYCRDCIPGNPRIYLLTEELVREFAASGFAHYAALKAKKSALFTEFATAERVLGEVLKLKCSGSCREGPRSELGCATDCAVRKCVIGRGLEGCWQCGDHARCEQLEALARFHPGLRANLRAIALYGIEHWIEHRGPHYPWPPGQTEP